MCAAQIFPPRPPLGDVNQCQIDPRIGISLIPVIPRLCRKSSSNGHHHHHHHPVDVSSSPTVAESKARFMREFNEENGSSLGLRDKKVGYSLDVVFV